jgi:hypothetical protein
MANREMENDGSRFDCLSINKIKSTDLYKALMKYYNYFEHKSL